MQLLHAQWSAWRRADRSETWAGARAALPFAVAIACLGVLFGGLATAAGLSPAAAVVMSATTFAGSAQFSAVSVLGGGGTALTAAGAAALVNARYLGMGAMVAETLPGRRWQRFLVAQLVVDESWIVAYLGDGHFSRQRLVGAAAVVYVAHVGATAIGAVTGHLIADPTTWGLDGAFAPLFVMLLWPHLNTRVGIAAALLGAAVALGLTPLVPPGLAVLGGGVAALLAPAGR